MSTGTLEQRVLALEREVEALKQKPVARADLPVVSKEWDKTFGAFANDPGFDEMVRLGKEIREQDLEDEPE